MLPLQSEAQLRHYLENDLGFNLDSVDFHEIYKNQIFQEKKFDTFSEFASVVASLIAVHETHFLRHPDQFNWIETQWLPRWLNRTSSHSQPLRILSAGCATGEEPYSLGARLHPLLKYHGKTLHIDAIDVSHRAIEIAKTGRYGLWSLRGVNVEEEKSWLDVHARAVHVADWIKLITKFEQHNIMDPLPPSARYDLILCRNVTIYMHEQAIKQCLTNLATGLADHGILIPGPSDCSPPNSVPLTTHWHQGNRFFQKSETKHPLFFTETTKPTQQTSNITTRNPPPKHTNICTKKIPETTDTLSKPSDYTAIESLIKTGHYTAARNMLESHLSKNPLDVRSHIMLSMLALDLDDIELARAEARKASFLDQDALFPSYLLLVTKQRSGDPRGETIDRHWLEQKITHHTEDEPVLYCEDITVGQLKEVLRAGNRNIV